VVARNIQKKIASEPNYQLSLLPSQVDTIADIVRRDCYIGDFSIDIVKAANKYDCIIQEVAFNGEDRDVSGMVYFDPKDTKFHIDINANDTEPRKRFAVAHELSHVLLHGDKLKSVTSNAIVDYDRSIAYFKKHDDIIKEIHANMLASAILLPRAQFETAYESTKGSVDGIADLFNVSKHAAFIRMETLNKFD